MSVGNGLMAGKRGLIMGVANNRSIAWGVAKSCAAAGAELAFTYQGEALKKRVEPLAAELGAHVAGHCDVTDESTLDAVFDDLRNKWGKFDFLVHAIAFSDKDELTGRYVDTSRENFNRTMDISVYSLTSVAKRAEPLLNEGGSILTLTYYGAEKVMPQLQCNGCCQSRPGSQCALSCRRSRKQRYPGQCVVSRSDQDSRRIRSWDFRYILRWNEYNSPLKRTVTIDEVGDSALYLLSPLSRGVTGEVVHVDSGYHVVGMKAVDARISRS